MSHSKQSSFKEFRLRSRSSLRERNRAFLRFSVPLPFPQHPVRRLGQVSSDRPDGNLMTPAASNAFVQRIDMVNMDNGAMEAIADYIEAQSQGPGALLWSAR